MIVGDQYGTEMPSMRSNHGIIIPNRCTSFVLTFGPSSAEEFISLPFASNEGQRWSLKSGLVREASVGKLLTPRS